jgi:putative FmdB family regulatory protein
MIHYNLHCTACGHDFDDWFGTMADWEAKKADYACPTCGAARIEKALMAPSLAAVKKAASAEPACNPAACGNASCPMAAGF